MGPWVDGSQIHRESLHQLSPSTHPAHGTSLPSPRWCMYPPTAPHRVFWGTSTSHSQPLELTGCKPKSLRSHDSPHLPELPHTNLLLIRQENTQLRYWSAYRKFRPEGARFGMTTRLCGCKVRIPPLSIQFPDVSAIPVNRQPRPQTAPCRHPHKPSGKQPLCHRERGSPGDRVERGPAFPPPTRVIHPRPLHFSVLSVVEFFGHMPPLSTRSVTYVPGPVCYLSARSVPRSQNDLGLQPLSDFSGVTSGKPVFGQLRLAEDE